MYFRAKECSTQHPSAPFFGEDTYNKDEDILNTASYYFTFLVEKVIVFHFKAGLRSNTVSYSHMAKRVSCGINPASEGWIPGTSGETFKQFYCLCLILFSTWIDGTFYRCLLA